MGSKVLAKFGVSQCSLNFSLHLAIALHLALDLLFAIAVMIRLVHRPLDSLSLHIRLDVHDQR